MLFCAIIIICVSSHQFHTVMNIFSNGGPVPTTTSRLFFHGFLNPFHVSNITIGFVHLSASSSTIISMQVSFVLHSWACIALKHTHKDLLKSTEKWYLYKLFWTWFYFCLNATFSFRLSFFYLHCFAPFSFFLFCCL